MNIRFCSSARGFVSFLALGLLPAMADTQIIPQVADGAGWSTTIVLANKTSSTQAVALSFNQQTVNGATTTWTPPFIEGVSQSSISLAAGSTLFLHTPGTSSALTQGWGQVDAAAGVSGYAIFTARTPGTPAQDATAPAVSASNRILVPFDNTSGFVSAVAVANPTNSAETVQATIRTSDGSTTGDLETLPAKGQTTFLMANRFPGTAGKSGLAEFYVASGSISIIALRANPSGAFTAAPVYFQTGNPIIGTPNTPQTSSPQTQVIPQVADGSGWSTTIVLTNTTTGELPVTLNFKQAIPNGAGATTAWIPPFQETSSLSFGIPAGSSRFLRTPGNAAGLSQGWAELTADPRVVGYAIFTSRSPGAPAQDSTAPAVSASSRILVPFDNSSGFITAIALVNPTASAETVSVNFRTSDGATSTATAPVLPSQGQITFLMPTQFATTAGKSGLAEFYVSSGTISIIALRANPSGAITSAPVFFETGTPIITTGGGGTPGGGGGGGSTPGTNPTPTEIDTWISRGSYTAGTISLNRITAYGDATGTVTTVTKSDTVGGIFQRIGGADLGKILRGQVPPDYMPLVPGSCTVYKITSAIDNPYPNLTYSGLDAGPEFTVNGPNGAQVARKTTQVGASIYNATGVPNTYLAVGSYAVSGAGGPNVGAFSGTVDIVPDFVVTNPDDLKSTINRGAGIAVRWTGGESSSVLTITGSSAAINLQTNAVDGGVFVCIQNVSAGQFTVPASVVTQLPASLSIGGITLRGTLSVVAAGKGARFPAPSGLDILTAINSWSWSFYPLYQ